MATHLRRGGSAAFLRVLLGICLAAKSHGIVRCGKGKFGQEKYLHVYVRSQIKDASDCIRPAPSWADDTDSKNSDKGQAWLCMRTSTSDAVVTGDNQCSTSDYTGLSGRTGSPAGGTAPWRRAGGQDSGWKVRS